MPPDAGQHPLDYQAVQPKLRPWQWIKRHPFWSAGILGLIAFMLTPDFIEVTDVTTTYICWECGKYQVRHQRGVMGISSSASVTERESPPYSFYKLVIDEPHQHDWRYLWVTDRSGTLLGRGIACGSDADATKREDLLFNAVYEVYQAHSEWPVAQRRELFHKLCAGESDNPAKQR